MLSSTYYGGNDLAMPPHVMPDRAFGMALDSANGHVYLTGEVGSDDFPTTDGSTLSGFTNLFVVELDLFVDVVADFSTSPVAGAAPLQVSFTNESAEDWEYYWWNFGDDTYSEEENPVHTYTEPGVYTVVLTTSGLGGIDSKVKVGYITVVDVWEVYLPLILR